MIPIDIVGVVRADLHAQRREPDGKLHASSDLIGSLRHTQLEYVGAPKKERSITEEIRTRTGWFWHNHLHNLLRDAGIPFMAEVSLEPWMPDGWSGTADWLFWHPEYQAFVLGDLKTTKGEAIKYRTSEGMSLEHHWQLSAYWYACVKMGLPMVKGFGILYLPMNTKLGEVIEPQLLEAQPVPEQKILSRMSEVKAVVDEYAEAVSNGEPNWAMNSYGDHNRYLNYKIAAPLERVQKLFWNKKYSVYELKLTPHWLTDFCPYENSLCNCSTQGVTKIGEYSLDQEVLIYKPRKGYEDIEPEVKLDKWQLKRLQD